MSSAKEVNKFMKLIEGSQSKGKFFKTKEEKKEFKLRHISMELRSKIDEIKAAVDFRGHNHGCNLDFYTQNLKSSFIMRKNLPTQKKMFELLSAMDRGETVDDPLVIKNFIHNTCPVCGEDLTFTFDGREFKSKTKCPFPNGMGEYSIDLPVPSGKLVVANDLRNLFKSEYEEIELYPWSKGWGFDIMTLMGCRRTFETYGKLGMAHGFISNTCPGMYRVDKNTLTLSMVKYDEESGNVIESEVPGEKVGGVCTDLWWYSIMDYDKYVEKSGEELDRHCDIIDVKPGMYKITHREHIFNIDENATDHFVVLKWSRKLKKGDLVKKKVVLVTTTVEDTIKADLIFNSDFYKTRGEVLDRLFFSTGQGISWLNGCVFNNMNPKRLLDNIDNSDFKPPKDIKKRMKDVNIKYIDTICEYSNINLIPDDVKDDWLNAAFEALDMAIAMDPNYTRRKVYKNSAMIKKAKKIKKDLEKRFKDRRR